MGGWEEGEIISVPQVIIKFVAVGTWRLVRCTPAPLLVESSKCQATLTNQPDRGRKGGKGKNGAEFKFENDLDAMSVLVVLVTRRI